MEKQFTVIFCGYEIHAGGKPLSDGTYAPTLSIAFGEGEARTTLDLPVPGAGSYVMRTEAQQSAFEEGIRWIKERC